MSGPVGELLALFERGERRQVAVLLTAAIADGLVQALGVASIMPFIAILSEPSLAETHRFFILLRELLPAAWGDDLLWVTGGIALLLLLAGNALTLLDYALSLRLFNAMSSRLSLRLLRYYLGSSLSAFTGRKLSDMTTAVLAEVDRAVVGTLMAGVGLVVDAVVALALVLLLLFIDPRVTLLAALLLGAGYLLVHLFIGREVRQLGQAHAEHEAAMFAAVDEGLALFKEVKLAHRGEYFLDRFATPARRIAAVTTRYELLKFIPAQLVEVLAFALILLAAMRFAGAEEDAFNAVGMIALYAYAAYRLVPVLKSLLDGIEAVQYGRAVTDRVVAELRAAAGEQAAAEGDSSRLVPREGIALEGLAFRYPDAPEPVFAGVTTRIPAGALTCIVGPSGAGKSTLLDVLIGMLPPSAGAIRVDGEPVAADNLRRWQNGLGYVPQNVRLLAGTLAENIAFGEAAIDRDRVRVVAEAAGLGRLCARLTAGLDTRVGDGGHSLSSGEAQRVGIARCLYRQPDVLMLDEATNELDAETEREVLAALLGVSGRTVIFVTHKTAIRERADHVIELVGR